MPQIVIDQDGVFMDIPVEEVFLSIEKLTTLTLKKPTTWGD